jgi:hypothetical protein
MKKVIVYCIAFLLVFCGLANELGNLLREKAIKDGKEIKIGGSCPNEEKIVCPYDSGTPTKCRTRYWGVGLVLDATLVAQKVGVGKEWTDYPFRFFEPSIYRVKTDAETGWERKPSEDSGCGTKCPAGKKKTCSQPLQFYTQPQYVDVFGTITSIDIQSPEEGCEELGFDKDKPCPEPGR